MDVYVPWSERDAITDLIQALRNDAQHVLQEQLNAQQTLISEERKARKALSNLPPTHREKIAAGDEETSHGSSFEQGSRQVYHVGEW